MSQLIQEWGQFVTGMMTIEGSFLVNGSSDPDGVYDGNTNLISVVRTSAGLFTVTIAGSFPVPIEWIAPQAWINPVDATQVKVCVAGVVEGTWSDGTRTFQILTTKVADTGESAYFDPLAADPDDNSRVCFRLRGSISPAGQD